MSNLVDIGPECFADEALSVISYKGNNYYRACDVFVRVNDDGGSSHCVKRSDHPGTIHEAYDGSISIGLLSKSHHFNECKTVEELIFQLGGAASMCWENVIGAGIFESDNAKDLCEDALLRLHELGVEK